MSENSEQNLLANVRLCDAIKWHPCLYDSKSKVYQMKHAVDAAWQSIANECEDTVGNCKLRWRIIRKSFLRSFRKNAPYNRYYLNDCLDFLKPHLPTLELNEAKASKAEDYDIIQLEEDLQDDDDDEEDEDENEGQQDESEEHNDRDVEDDDEDNDEEVEEYELRDEPTEDPDEDSDTASAEETLKASRAAGRRKGKESNMSTPDIEEGEEDENRQGTQDKTGDSDRIGRRLMRTRKANSRYMEYDIYDRRYKKEQKQEEKRKADKRPLEPSKPEKPETKTDEKRPRRSVEPAKTGPTTVREDVNKPKLLPKKVEVKLIKPKAIELPPAETKAPKLVPKGIYKVRTSSVKIDKSLAEISKNTKPTMVDNSTNIVTTKTVDKGTQYEVDEPRTVDDDFIESLKPQMALMNSRQKFSFKRRVFQALMDVFDDSTNFPNKNELIALPPKGAPRFDKTTTAELILMRELANLVTAAKSTPEIMNARERMATPDNDIEDFTPSPTKSPYEKSSSLMSSASTSNATGKRSDTLGLPRHILQKVVKVAGSNGGTILAHEGDKRRVYRIYPKGTLPPSVANNTGGSGSSIGTFYVTPPKSQTVTNTQANTMIRTTTQLGATANGKPITFTTITKTGTQQASNLSTASTSASVGANVASKVHAINGNGQVAITRQRVSVRAPVTTQRRYSNSNTSAKNSPLQNKVITSTNPPATTATQEKPSSSNAYPVQRYSASSLEGTSKTGLSQIQISQPVSLNTAAVTPRENSVKAFLSSGMDNEPYDGNSRDNEIFPDNPQPEAVAEDVAANDDLLVPTANIKDEPID